MAHPIANVNIATDTWFALITEVNLSAGVISGNAVTTAANTTGELTNGNAVVNGTFSAQTMVAIGALRGGTVAAAANLVVSSNVVTGANVFVVAGSNVGIGTGSPNAAFEVNGAANVDGILSLGNTLVQKVVATRDVVVNNNLGTNTTGYQVVWSFANNVYNSGKITAQIKTLSPANSVQISEMVVAQSNGAAEITVYATVACPAVGGSQSPLGTWGAQINGGSQNFELLFLQAVANSSMKLVVDMIN